jgi:hypothetical protein
MPLSEAAASWFMYVTPGAASNARTKKRYRSVFVAAVKGIEALLSGKRTPSDSRAGRILETVAAKSM